MIKKHDHRKHNRQLLKMPKSTKTANMHFDDSNFSSNLDSDTNDNFDKLKNNKTN